MNYIIKILQFSPIVFSIIGLICGLIISEKLLIAFICLGACMGAVIGIISAVICLIANQKCCVSIAALVSNILIFVVLAKELQIIG
jgi:hypothetical protein